MINGGERRRILGQMLNHYQGQNVCVIGTFMEANPNGKTFKITSTDKQTVTIKLEQPIQEYVEGILQIEGMVNNDNSISCSRYVTLPTSEPIDEDLYNQVVNLMEKHPSYY